MTTALDAGAAPGRTRSAEAARVMRTNADVGDVPTHHAGGMGTDLRGEA